MASLATHRLIDAAAKLDPADRALLNLWVNRGLDDDRLTELTGLSIDALHVRRQKIVAQLAGNLGLPDENVRAALTQIFPDAEVLSPPTSNGGGGAAPSHNGGMTVAESPSHGPVEAQRSRRWLWVGLLALVLIAAIAVAIIAGEGRSSRAPRPAVSAPATPSTATPATPSTATPAAQTTTVPGHPTTANPVPPPLAALPGGPTHATGSINLSGKLTNLKLNLTVMGLPSAHAGHYEVWLYNSVIDSQPLARLRNGHRRLTARLPANVRHYRWIDISFQPVGEVNHSGESELRASNPAHTTMARPR